MSVHLKAYVFILNSDQNTVPPDHAPPRVRVTAANQVQARQVLHGALNQISDDLKTYHYVIQTIDLPSRRPDQ